MDAAHHKSNGVNTEGYCRDGYWFEDDSIKTHLSVFGRKIDKFTGKMWRITHGSLRLPPCMVGGLIGGMAGILGGTVYKIYQNARGQGAATKGIWDYAKKFSIVGSDLVKTIISRPLKVASVALTVPMIFGGMAVSVVATVIRSVGFMIYQGYSFVTGDGVHFKSLSEYVIDLLDLATDWYKVGMVVTGCFAPLAALVVVQPAPVIPLLVFYVYLLTNCFPAAAIEEDRETAARMVICNSHLRSGASV